MTTEVFFNHIKKRKNIYNTVTKVEVRKMSVSIVLSNYTKGFFSSYGLIRSLYTQASYCSMLITNSITLKLIQQKLPLNGQSGVWQHNFFILIYRVCPHLICPSTNLLMCHQIIYCNLFLYTEYVHS